MVDETRDDADNEITRIVRRPGPKVLPVNILTPQTSPAAPPVASPRPPANDSAPLIIAPAVPPVAPLDGSHVAPPVAIDRPRPVMSPPARPIPPTPAVATPSSVVAPPSAVSSVSEKPAVAVAPAPVSTPTPQASLPVAATPGIAKATLVGKAVSPVLEPVVGWLVVVKGPGRGVSREIVTGRNSLGSGADEDIRIAFGDPAIAPHGHLYIVYDEEAREFVVEDGKQKVVVRLNGKLLTETMPIGSGDELRIGATTFRFVALCGPDFDWHVPEEKGEVVGGVGADRASADEVDREVAAATPEESAT